MGIEEDDELLVNLVSGGLQMVILQKEEFSVSVAEIQDLKKSLMWVWVLPGLLGKESNWDMMV